MVLKKPTAKNVCRGYPLSVFLFASPSSQPTLTLRLGLDPLIQKSAVLRGCSGSPTFHSSSPRAV